MAAPKVSCALHLIKQTPFNNHCIDLVHSDVADCAAMHPALAGLGKFSKRHSRASPGNLVPTTPATVEHILAHQQFRFAPVVAACAALLFADGSPIRCMPAMLKKRPSETAVQPPAKRCAIDSGRLPDPPAVPSIRALKMPSYWAQAETVHAPRPKAQPKPTQKKLPSPPPGALRLPFTRTRSPGTIRVRKVWRLWDPTPGALGTLLGR